MNVSERDEFLHNLVYAYCRWKYAMVFIFLILVFMVFFAAYLLTPTWKAEVHLLVEPTLPPPTTSFANPTRPAMQQSSSMHARHAIRVLKGQPIAYAVAREFELDERLREKTENPGSLREKVIGGIFDSIGECVSFVTGLLGADDEEETDWLYDAAKDFHDGIFAWVSVDLVAETDIVELTINGETPELANDIAMFMVETLKQELLAVSEKSGGEALVAFEKELENAKARQSAAEQSLQEFLEANGGIPPPDMTRSKASDLNDHEMLLATLRETLTDSHPDVISERAMVAQIKAALATLPAKESEYSRLVTDVNTCRELREDLQSHVNELRVSTDAGVASLNISVIQQSMVSPASNPDNPAWAIVTLIALIFAGGVTVILPVFVEYWRDPVRGPADLLTCGVTPLAVAPRLRPRSITSTPKQEEEAE